MRPLCYVCEKNAVKASGYSQSDVLILGDAPSHIDIIQGKPFAVDVKKQTNGNVLRKELAELGYDLFQFRLALLWWHTPNKNEECFKASLNACLDEAKGKKAILLVGADCVSYFTDYKVSDVNGLQVDSNMLSAPAIFACISPSIVYAKSVGEIKFALKQFTDYIKKEGLM